jgi:hypothetical protein
MAVDTGKVSETDARLENYMLRSLRDRVQEPECESLRLQWLLQILKPSQGRGRRTECANNGIVKGGDCSENQHLQYLLADRRTNSPSPAPEGFLHQPQLFDLLNLGSHSPEGELQRVISAGRTQPLALQSRAV